MTFVDLPGGRVLDVLVSGPERGTPLIFHHGTPGAVTRVGAIERAAHAHGLRLVTFSRAGYGGSTRQPGRTVAVAAEDVADLLDHLGAARCVVAGWSGGGPHALATAAGIPDRVAGVLVIAGVAPYDANGLAFLAGMGEQNIDEFGRATRGEADLRPFLEREAAGLRGNDVAALLDGMRTLLPEVDRAVITDEFGRNLADSFAEGLRTGVDGWLDDDLAFVAPWGFALNTVAVPSFLWQGSADLMVPYAHGEWLAAHIPGVTAHLLPGEGHLSIAIGAIDSMLDELTTTL